MPGITVGTVRLDLLPDAEIPISGDAVFAYAERSAWTAHVSADGKGMLIVPVRPLLIREPDGITLVDTGFGNIASHEDESAPIGNTLDELAAPGVTPDDITRVIITHAHGDHVLGNMRRMGNENVPTYPNAEFVMQSMEADSVRWTSVPLWDLYFGPIDRAGRLRLIEGDTALSGTISCMLTQGHTIGHQSVVVSSNGESACYLGDLAIHTLNLQKPEWGADWAWSRDHDRENRINMRQWARETGGILILPHDAEHPFVTVDDDLSVRPAVG